jgi:hypothetical protein
MLYTRKYYRRAFPFLLFIKRIYHTQVEWSMSKNMHTVTQATNDEVKMKAEDESNEWLVTTEAKSFFFLFLLFHFSEGEKKGRQSQHLWVNYMFQLAFQWGRAGDVRGRKGQG